MKNALDFLNSLNHRLTEVRILTKDRYCQVNGKRAFVGNTISGYYTPDNYEGLVADIQPFNKNKAVIGIYVTLQDIDTALEARASNRLEYNAHHTTADTHVKNFGVFPIDIDADNPAGTSASESELAESKGRAATLSAFLSAHSIPHQKAMSGNGWHLLIYINKLECNAENTVRFKALGDLVAHHYGSDVKNYNPARVWKLYGTWAGKGDDIPDRPHREAKIYLNGGVERIAFDTLEQTLTSILSPIPVERKPSIPSSTYQNDITLQEWLDTHNITYTQKAYKGTFKFQVDCPHDPTHKSPDAWITDEGGAWQFSCSHNSCRHRSTWQAFKDAHGIVTTAWKASRQTPQRNGQPVDAVGDTTPKPIPIPVGQSMKRPEFPDTAGELFIGNLQNFYEAYVSTNPFPASYLMPLALTQLSVAIGRRACVSVNTEQQKRRRLYANTYSALVGHSFVAGKTDVLNTLYDDILDFSLNDMIDDPMRELMFMPTVNSGEGLINYIRTDGEKGSPTWEGGLEEGRQVVILADELKQVFTNAQRSSTLNIITYLNRLYNCPRLENMQTLTNPAKAHFPVVNILGSLTYDCLSASITASEILNGFVNRFMFWDYEWVDTMRNVRDPLAEPHELWIRKLKGLRAMEGVRNFILAAPVWEQYYDRLDAIRRNVFDNPEDLYANSTSRACVHALKIALLMSVVNNKYNDNVVSEQTWNAAWAVAEYLSKVKAYLFKSVASNELSKQEQKFLENLENLGNECSRTELRRQIGCSNGKGGLATADFNKVKNALIEGGVIAIYKEGRSEMIVRVEI